MIAGLAVGAGLAPLLGSRAAASVLGIELLGPVATRFAHAFGAWTLVRRSPGSASAERARRAAGARYG